MKETYVAARNRLLVSLHEKGWTTKPFLKTPYAVQGDMRITFKPQAVYLGEHSTFLDIRGMSIDDFLKYINRMAERDIRVGVSSK